MRLNRSIVLAAIIAVTAGMSASPVLQAADAPVKATGTITGKVLNEKGEPAKGVRVGALVAGTLANRKGAGGKAAGDTTPAREKIKDEVLAKATTHDDGTYTLTDVPVGKVRIIAGGKGAGFGYSRELVEVKAGETVHAPEIKLRTVSDRPTTRPSRPIRARP